jgi:hypothetical protein
MSFGKLNNLISFFASNAYQKIEIYCFEIEFAFFSLKNNHTSIPQDEIFDFLETKKKEKHLGNVRREEANVREVL